MVSEQGAEVVLDRIDREIVALLVEDARRSNKEIASAMKLAEEAGPDSEAAKRAAAFAGKLVPQGATLSEIANEPPKLLSKLTTVSSVLFHSEGPPPASCYAVVDEMEQKIDAEIAAWRAYAAQIK